MSQSYKKSCMYCNQTIEMNDRASGKWLPYNMDGTQHDCRNQTRTRTQTQTGTKISNNNNNNKEPEAKAWVKEILEGPKLKEIEARLKRVESIVIDPKK